MLQPSQERVNLISCPSCRCIFLWVRLRMDYNALSAWPKYQQWMTL